MGTHPRHHSLNRNRPVCHNQAILSGREFTLNGNLNELGHLVEEVARFCRENELAGDIEFDLNLAMEELFTNAVRHGGCEGAKDVVRVRLEPLGEGVRAEFCDRGREFDPTGAPEPDVTAPLSERPVGGLGLHLVRRIMRDIEYRRADGWNRLTMLRPIRTEETG
jgi:serine/threonine-protein kinase RsbW